MLQERTPTVPRFLRILSFSCALLLLCAWISHRWDENRSVAGEIELSGSVQQVLANARPSELSAPSEMDVPEFEAELFPFLKRREYVELGWQNDGRIRDTGPFIKGTYYGTHPAVRVFYSPEVISWLERGRKGSIPDGAMIVKEQYAPPAVRHEGKTEQELRESLESWTVMIKDSTGSQDGWFWSNPGAEQEVVDNHADNAAPISGFGLYCVRCHASTQSPGTDTVAANNEFTFASLRNIKGYPGEPLLFRVDDSWQQPEQPTEETDLNGEALSVVSVGGHPRCTHSRGTEICPTEPQLEFLKQYGQIRSLKRTEIAALPPSSRDDVCRCRKTGQEFITSNQCMSCHAGLMEPFGPTMFVSTGKTSGYGDPGWNISPYGEWRWTPMGLAGRDPIFLAQLESELAGIRREFAEQPQQVERLTAVLQDTCLKCHGAMGRHQFHSDDPNDQATFSLSHCKKTIGEAATYGALARDGISCMVCHRMTERPQPADDLRPYLQFYLETSVTGNLYFGPKDELYGPFEDKEIAPYAMKHALGITPKHNPFLKSSRHCGSCHTVTLPAIDEPVSPEHFDELNDAQIVKEFQNFHHHVEQATYLEWLNSSYENEFNKDNPQAKSCQECHMSGGLHDEQDGLDIETLQTRMAIIQDLSYPDAENLAAHDDLNVRVRKTGYARHNFSGLNLYLLELFDQFPDILGVQRQDYMTGSDLDIEHARRNFLLTASKKTADLELDSGFALSGELEATVTITNKTGHRFPTGVGFRRAFLELLVVEKTPGTDRETVLWSSGRTNSMGVLVDQNGNPLPTEFFNEQHDGSQAHQPHHEVITSPSQVQIYESLICNAQDRFTTSFIHGCYSRKDNRLLPRGWTPDGPDPALTGRYLEATHPQGDATDDPRYQNGSGTDSVSYRITLPENINRNNIEVRATLYYQAIPPYFLKNLFDAAPESEAVQRLHFLLSNLKTQGTAIENWKLKVVSAASVPLK